MPQLLRVITSAAVVAVVWVDHGGATTCSVPSAAHPTIQTAVNDAACDTVVIAAGVFDESLSIGRSLTLRGAGSELSFVQGRVQVTTAPAAVRGEHPDPDNEAYGVVGVSSSVWGAGVAAANLEGGPDVVLDGAADGTTDTVLAEWGIARSSASDERFSFGNLGGGAFTLDVYGTIAGSALDCPGCVGSPELADRSVSGTKIADGAVGSSALRANAVSTGHLADGAVTTAKIADGSVDSLQVRGGAITTAKIADQAVTSAKIADGAVTMADLADDSVGTAEIELGGVQSDDIDAGAVGSGHLAADAVTTAKIADSSVTGTKLANDAVTAAKVANNAVTNAKIADSAVTSAKIAGEAVSTWNILDGTITRDDISIAVGSGIYVRKDQLDINQATLDLAPGGTGWVVAACDDEDDLPLTGSCDFDAYIEYGGESISDWRNEGYAAKFYCNGDNPSAYTQTLTARIVCVSN